MELSNLIVNQRRLSPKHPSLWADAATLLYGGAVGYAETRGYHLGQYILFLPIIPRIAYEAIASYIRNINRETNSFQPKSENSMIIGSIASGSFAGTSLAALECITGSTIGVNL